MSRALSWAAALFVVLAIRAAAASFFTIAASNYDVGTNPISIAVADFNLDGWPDIVVLRDNDPNLAVLTNKGDGTFAPASSIPAAVCNNVIAQDVNGDARPDLILLRNEGATFVYTNVGGGFAFASSNNLGFIDAIGFAMADLDGDGWVELLTVRGGPVQVFTNNHLGTFTHSADAFTGGFYPWAIVPGDFDNNGSLDVIVSHYEDRLVLMTNDGSGVLHSARFYSGFGGPLRLRAADMNNDGLLDCFFGGSLQLNNGDGTFHAGPTNAGSIFSLSDLDGDGWTEVVTTGLEIRTSDDDRPFFHLAQLRVPSTVRDIAIADLNKDGRLDLVIANGATGSNGFASVVFQYAQLTLAIQPAVPSGTNVVITWPSTDPPMFLEVTDQLPASPAHWSSVSAGTNALGTDFEVARPAAARAELFRLRD